MNYTDTAGNPATGVVWSPGPLPGTVWVLPYSGAETPRRALTTRKPYERADMDIEHALDVISGKRIGQYSDAAMALGAEVIRLRTELDATRPLRLRDIEARAQHRAVMLPNGRIAVRCWPLAEQPWMVTDPTSDPMGADSPAVCVRWLRDDQIPHDAVLLVPQHLTANFDD